MSRQKQKPGWQKELAVERIRILFKEAEKIFRTDSVIADKIVKRARTIGMRYRIKIPKELKRLYCKHCHSYLKPGVNCTVRLSQKRQSKIIVTCGKCKGIMRYPYQKEKLKKA